MKERLKVAILYGGNTLHHEKSLANAALMNQHLDAKKYEVIPIGIDKIGQLHMHDIEDLKFENKLWPVHTDKSFEIPSLIDNNHFFTPIDVVIPVVYGGKYENGGIQGLLEFANIPYLGGDVLSSAITMNKDLCRRLASGDEIQPPEYRVLRKIDHDSLWEYQIREMVNLNSWPLIVKPNCGIDSLGITKVHSASEALKAIQTAFQYDDEVIIEAFIDARELVVSIIPDKKSDEIRVSLPGEINFKNEDVIYSNDLKILKSYLVEFNVPANIDANLTQMICQNAKEIYQRLKCSGMVTIEFLLDEINQKLYFNEINTLSSCSPGSLSAILWDKIGIKFEELLEHLIESAILKFEINHR